MTMKKVIEATPKQTQQPEKEIDEESSAGSESVYDSGIEQGDDDDEESDEQEISVDSNVQDQTDDDEDEADDEDEDDESEEEFEEIGSSSDEGENEDELKDDDSSDEDIKIHPDKQLLLDYESKSRSFDKPQKRTIQGQAKPDEEKSNEELEMKRSQFMHTDDLSSDDEDADGLQNRIGKVPLHWYDEYDHMGYNVHGEKVVKSTKGNRIEQALANADGKNATTIYDPLNDKEVPLTQRQLELVRRIQEGAFAHPEFEAHADSTPYFSGVDTEVSGMNTAGYEPKNRFVPSKYEGMMVRDLVNKLRKGLITMDYLEGKVRDMNDIRKKNKDTDEPREFWDGSEVDELALRKGPMQLIAPKVPPPGHAESYNPSEEYLPTEEELKQWSEMDVKNRPYGLLIPKKFSSLRAVGAYEHSVREAFERCLNLYLAPRAMKRRLNIDPESLVPSIPKASDLRPFPTSQCVRYDTPFDKEAPMIRCLSVSPGGQYLASGATDGFVRMWEVSTGRLMKSWNVSSVALSLEPSKDKSEIEESTPEIKPVVSLQWNPNKSHHCLVAAVGSSVIIIATGTGGVRDAQVTDALLSKAASNEEQKISKTDEETKTDINSVVLWKSLIKLKDRHEKTVSAFGGFSGPVCAIQCLKGEISCVKWHARGDYVLSISPKATVGASVLIHRISSASSQQPFKKNIKGSEVQCACFHPSKPFLFVATKQHIRIYHLLQQNMVKRLISGCKWISSIDIHPGGDHLIAGSLDHKLAWFDLDLSAAPYKSFKYHTKSIRCVGYHPKYPLFATSSDDGTVHVFHSTVYSDFVRNPLIVPVKILKGHHQPVKRLGVLSIVFHPSQPWLFSAGADGVIHLFQDI